jgi:HEAT repeat protein
MPWAVGRRRLRDVVMQLDEGLGHMLHTVWNRAAAGALDGIGSKEGNLGGRVHAEAVEAAISALVPDDWKGDRLSVHDLVVLSAAACLHDVGKLVNGAGDHSAASAQEIWSRAPSYGLPQEYAEAVAVIVEPHGRGDMSALDERPRPVGAGAAMVASPRLLGAILMLADVLHCDLSRVPDQVAGAGGRDPDVRQKVRFRRRCRGWVPGAEGEVVVAFRLEADDGPDAVGLIAGGLRMMEEQLADAAPILAQAGLPHRLRQDVDDRAVQWKAEQERRTASGFLAHYPFTPDDAALFKGRDEDLERLHRLAMGAPAMLLVGASGVGKTSLLGAGLLPVMVQSGWSAALVRPLEPDPLLSLGTQAWRQCCPRDAPPADASPLDYWRDIVRRHGRGLLVIIDQLEDLLRLPRELLDALAQDILAVHAGAAPRVKLVLSYRADAEGTLGPLWERLYLRHRMTLGPLTPEGARSALVAAFETSGIGIDPEREPGGTDLLDRMLSDLHSESLQAVGEGIYPPYLQMVGVTLEQALSQSAPRILTAGLYEGLGRAHGIVASYLLGRLEAFGEQRDLAERVLFFLSGATTEADVRARAGLAELASDVQRDEGTVQALLARLTAARLVRIVDGEYEIAHDHLARMLEEQSPQDGAAHDLRAVRQSLRARAAAFPHVWAPGTREEMLALYRHRERIKLTHAEARYLLASLAMGHGAGWAMVRSTTLADLRAAVGGHVLLRHANEVNPPFLVPLARVLGRDALSVLWSSINGPVGWLLSGPISELVTPDDTSDLLRRVDEGSKAEREAAVAALVSLGRREAWPILWKMAERRRWPFDRADIVNMATEADVPELQARLHSTRRGVRAAAALALVKVAPRLAWPALWDLAEGASARPMREAIVQIATPDDAPELLRRLTLRTPGAALAAASALARLGRREAWPFLWKLAKARYGCSTHHAIAELTTPNDIPELRQRLRSRDKGVCLCASLVTGIVKDRAIWPLLVEMARGDFGWVGCATQALADMATPADAPELVELQQSGGQGAVRAVAAALAAIRVRDAWDGLWHAAEVPNVDVADAIARLAEPEDIPELTRRAKATATGVRRAAAMALARLRHRAAWDTLWEVLESYNWAFAVDALAALATPDDLPELRSRLASRRKTVRDAAALALARVKAREAWPALWEACGRGAGEAAWRAIADMSLPSDGPELTGKIQGGKPGEKVAAALALAKVGNKDVLGSLGRVCMGDVPEPLRIRLLLPLAEAGDMDSLLSAAEDSRHPDAAEHAWALLCDIDRVAYCPFEEIRGIDLSNERRAR